ncbi:zinc finger, C3HC4 type (RING finger) protein (macronuclear) [Tetrahymena thermophila SB210]|uniref:Zinc finger, C3HC4 type (RING finger) protein n=1 Tax=Tetrahymena thermophila (strain SB210) TaxID=312017 RepID=I7M7L2_TETTS|nr:zinc finger, C3HC4 type (RING finger) protein [Tetrahymena thermophila SB210]EAR94159.4 zinc finger, C3HC4 type (RING finger) protein [Tetrahymena thermophila SB210]|eukprot:XP_001014404.4 zinc finger, C3HC4 type (RING finger) protein [Tetrahymena thermophila SB210]
MKFFERIRRKLQSQINLSQRNQSNGSSHSKANHMKKINKKNRVDSQELKKLFLLKVRERSCQIQGKEIEEYETKVQLLNQTPDIKPPNQDQDLKCKICNYYFIYPIVLRCSHAFCERCLDEYSTRQQFCIECEEPLSHSKYIKSESLQSIVERHLLALGTKQHSTYQNTKKMRDELRNKRYIKEFSVNQNIDIRDKYFDWYEGIIMNIISSDDKKYLVIQHKNSQSKVEIINSLSPNIAPHGFFTKRKDLKTRDEKKLDIVKSLVNQYEEIRSQRRQSQQEQQQQQQQQQQQESQNDQIENQENFHDIILRHLTSVQSLPYMISLMNGAMRRSESQQRIMNTIQITVNNNGQQQDGHSEEPQVQIQLQQQQLDIQQQGNSNQPPQIINIPQAQNQQQNNPQEENIENSSNNNQNGNNEEQTEIVIEEYEAENEDDDEEYLDEDQDILSNSQYSYQNLDAIQYVQEWQ